MKKSLLILFACCLGAPAVMAQQIPNAGFENWNNTSGYNMPDNWGNTTQLTGALGVYTVTKGTPGNPGNAYLKLTTLTAMGQNVPGVAVSGNLDLSNPSNPKYSGFAYSGRPSALTGAWQYMAMSGTDQGVIFVLLSKWNSSTNSRDTIGTVTERLQDMVMSWETFSLPINYVNTATPDTALVVLSSSGAGSTITPNSYLYVDDLAFDGGTSGINDTKQVVGNLNIFPVPASNSLSISFNFINKAQNLSISLCDMQGRILLQESTNQNQYKLDISAIASGNYFLNISDGSNVQVEKVVIKK